MKNAAARVIVGAYGAVLCGMLGAGVRGDDQLQTPGKDIATGAAIVAAAMAVKWALQRLDMELPATTTTHAPRTPSAWLTSDAPTSCAKP